LFDCVRTNGAMSFRQGTRLFSSKCATQKPPEPRYIFRTEMRLGRISQSRDPLIDKGFLTCRIASTCLNGRERTEDEKGSRTDSPNAPQHDASGRRSGLAPTVREKTVGNDPLVADEDWPKAVIRCPFAKFWYRSSAFAVAKVTAAQGGGGCTKPGRWSPYLAPLVRVTAELDRA